LPTSVPGGAAERCPQVSDTLQRERLLAILSSSFGALALLMAAIGLYGVTSYAVNLRRTEIGIRMALGATRGSVIRLVLGRVAFLIGGGIVVRLAVAGWLPANRASRLDPTRVLHDV
jgi:ABC-type antimicrobial peptide transport system permease subunit